MKKIFMYAAVASIGIATLSGCSKSSSSSSQSMKATINGASYSNSNVVAVITSGQLLVESGNSGTSITYPSIELAAENYTGAGTYSISSTSDNLFTVDSGTSSTGATAQGGSGTLTVTSASSSSISGTFTFTCLNGTTVTGGSFTAKVE